MLLRADVEGFVFVVLAVVAVLDLIVVQVAAGPAAVPAAVGTRCSNDTSIRQGRPSTGSHGRIGQIGEPAMAIGLDVDGHACAIVLVHRGIEVRLPQQRRSVGRRWPALRQVQSRPTPPSWRGRRNLSPAHAWSDRSPVLACGPMVYVRSASDAFDHGDLANTRATTRSGSPVATVCRATMVEADIEDRAGYAAGSDDAGGLDDHVGAGARRSGRRRRGPRRSRPGGREQKGSHPPGRASCAGRLERSVDRLRCRATATQLSIAGRASRCQPRRACWHGTQNRACGRISRRSTGMSWPHRSHRP